MKLFIISIITIAFISGNGSAEKEKEKTAEPAPMVVDSSKQLSKEVALVVDNKYDPVCKMPVTAGITDTTTSNGKTIGFCSPECKDEFLANPKDYQLVMKK